MSKAINTLEKKKSLFMVLSQWELSKNNQNAKNVLNLI